MPLLIVMRPKEQEKEVIRLEVQVHGDDNCANFNRAGA
jgi:hypothetical protein